MHLQLCILWNVSRGMKKTVCKTHQASARKQWVYIMCPNTHHRNHHFPQQRKRVYLLLTGDVSWAGREQNMHNYLSVSCNKRFWFLTLPVNWYSVTCSIHGEGNSPTHTISGNAGCVSMQWNYFEKCLMLVFYFKVKWNPSSWVITSLNPQRTIRSFTLDLLCIPSTVLFFACDL